MKRFSWIMSYGGPLLCIETKYASSWGGNVRLTVAKEGAKNDYERLTGKPTFLQTVALSRGSALIVVEGARDTSFWKRPDDGKLFIVQIICCEEDVDFEAVMQAIEGKIFAAPCETSDFCFTSSDLILFDSAEEGGDPDKKSIAMSIEPGRYKILTQTHDTDERSSLILHRFDKVD